MRVFSSTLAETGRVALVSLLAVIASVLVLEFVSPGLSGNVVSAQRLVAAAVVSAALSLLAPAPRPGPFGVAMHAFAAALAALLAFEATFAFFAAFPALRWQVSSAAAFAAALPFLAFALREKRA
ncbi:MAG: hypothetical protein RLZZ324_577 [Candidatus Parcubacteria bacterium]|jgi:hypothetical protein